MANSVGDLIADRNLAELLSYWATFFGIILALIGGAWAWRKHRRDLKDQEWSRARSSFASFIDTAIAHPEFVPGCWSHSVQNDQSSLYEYLWFMAKFLWAAEEILKTMQSEEIYWRQAISQIVSEHADFFRSAIGQHESSCYDTTLRDLIRGVVEQLDEEGLLFVSYDANRKNEKLRKAGSGGLSGERF